MNQLSDDFPMTMEVECDTRPDSMNFGAPLQNCPPVAVAFGMHPVLDGKASKEAGRQVFRDVEFVKIAIPGDRNSLFFQPAEDVHRRRFPRAYEAFKRREHTAVTGTPIQYWPPISRAQALNLKVMHIDTVEALAGVHDGNIDRLGSTGRELREKARAWLKEAETGAAATALAGEKKALQDQIESLQAQISALAIQQSQGVNTESPQASLQAPLDPEDDVTRDVVAAARKTRVRSVPQVPA